MLHRPAEIIQQIYSTTPNKNQLTILQNMYGTLDVSYDGYTAAAVFAKEGKASQMWFLYNHFNINLDRVLYGAAVGNQENLLREVQHFWTNPLMLIAGYARGLHIKKMRDVMQDEYTKADLMGRSQKKYRIIRTAVIELARNGHFDEVINLLEWVKATNFPSDHTDVVYGAALNSAISLTQVIAWIQQVHSTVFPELGYNAAINGAAEIGNLALIEELAKQYTYEAHEQLIHINEKTMGSVQLTSAMRFSQAVIDGAACGGQLALITKCIDATPELAVRDYFFKRLALAAISNGHFWMIKELLVLYPQCKKSLQDNYIHDQLMQAAIKEEQFEVVTQLMKLIKATDKMYFPSPFFYDSRGELRPRSLSNKRNQQQVQANVNMANYYATAMHNNKKEQNKEIYKSDKFIACENEYQTNKLRYASQKRNILNHVRLKFFASHELQQAMHHSDFKDYLIKSSIGVSPAKDNLINYVMQQYQFNFGQALLLTDYLARVWLLQVWNQLYQKRLNPDILFRITKFLFHITISDHEISAVQDKMIDFRHKDITRMRQNLGIFQSAPLIAAANMMQLELDSNQHRKSMDLSQ